MKLVFVGPRIIIRTVLDVTWRPENHYVAETPLEMAADLLTNPGQEFLIARATDRELAQLAELLNVPAQALRKYLYKSMKGPVHPAAPAKVAKPARPPKPKKGMFK